MNAIAKHFFLEPGTLIEFDGQSVVVTEKASDGLIVRDRYVGENDASRYFVIQDFKVQELLTRCDVFIDQSFSSENFEDKKTGQISDDHWSLRSDEDKQLAMQREAWCLASRSVLKSGKFTETRIAKRFSEIEKLALDRQRLLALGNNKNGSFVALTYGPKSVSEFCKKYFTHSKPHAKSLLPKPLKGNREPKLPDAVDAILDSCCQKYLSRSQPSKTSIVKLVNRVFRQANQQRRANGLVSQLEVPHQNTIYRRLGKFSALEFTLGRDGPRAAQKAFSPTQHGVRALKIGEMIELDFWTGDVMTFAKKSAFWDLLTPDLQKDLEEGKSSKKRKGKKNPRQRLFVCAAIDVATRQVLGISLAEKENSRTVSEVLDMVMRDKSEISRMAGCKKTWHQHCGIGTIIVDTGSAFLNDEVQSAISALGASIIYGRAAVPMDKPFVERLFGGFRTRFADELPGKTGYSIDCLVGYDSEAMAVFNAEELRHLITRFVVDDYPLEQHAGLFGKRPVDAWTHHERYGVLAPPQPHVRRNATGLRLKRLLSKEGLRICGVPFANQEALVEVFKRGQQAVEVRLDPNDLREVTVVLNGRGIRLENQRKDLEKYTLRTWMRAIQKMTEPRPQDRIFYEYVLAEHAEWFHQKIDKSIEMNGLPSSEMRPEELDWFEARYCVKLQIDRNPEAVYSADMDELLSGGEGRGIFTAEDIKEEKRRNTASAVSESASSSAAIGAGDASEKETVGNPSVRSIADTAETSARGSTQPPKETKDASKQRFSGAPKGKGKLK